MYANYEYVAEMMDFCDKNQITSYAYLLRYAKANNEQWLRVLVNDSCFVMIEYLKSLEKEIKRRE